MKLLSALVAHLSARTPSLEPSVRPLHEFWHGTGPRAASCPGARQAVGCYQNPPVLYMKGSQ